MSDLTVFVGTFNRTLTLERCLLNLERQISTLKIVVVDNGSRDESALAYLDELADEFTVYRMPGIDDVPAEPGDAVAHGGQSMMQVQRNYSEAMRQEQDEYGNASRLFAVCDCDTAPDGHLDSIECYRQLAEVLHLAVGPHLKLNVHRNYPLRSLALILNARVLFRDRMFWHEGIPYSYDDIDSTFHLFPAAPSFDRLGMKTVRVGPPYWTTHTDWLIDACNPGPEVHSYVLGGGDASRWAGTWIREWFAAWLRSPEEAFALVENAEGDEDDYWRPGFIRSWMLQYGHGCEPDPENSRFLLRASVPDHSPCWEYEQHWDALVYDDDQSCLGWG